MVLDKGKVAFLIAIAGGSASGKTTLAFALREAISGRKVSIVSADRFNLRGQVGAPAFRSPATGKEEFDMNHPDAYDLKLLIGEIDREFEDGTEAVIAEGLMVLHHESIRERADLRLYVDLEADVRALRRMLRDMEGGRTYSDPQSIARYYLESARLGHEKYVEPSKRFADLIIRGDGNFQRAAKLIASVCPV